MRTGNLIPAIILFVVSCTSPTVALTNTLQPSPDATIAPTSTPVPLSETYFEPIDADLPADSSDDPAPEPIILIGLVFAGAGLFELWRAIRLKFKGRSTVGTITEVVRRRRYTAIYVSFKKSKKGTVVFKTRAFGWNNRIIGSRVPVLYDPDNAKKAIINTVDYMYLRPFGLIGFGLYFSLAYWLASLS